MLIPEAKPVQNRLKVHTHTHLIPSGILTFKSHASVAAVIINLSRRLGWTRLSSGLTSAAAARLGSARLSSALVSSRSFGSYCRLVRSVPGLVRALVWLRGTTVAAALRHHGQNASRGSAQLQTRRVDWRLAARSRITTTALESVTADAASDRSEWLIWSF